MSKKVYTVALAAVRVGKTVRTIERWISEGLEFTPVTTGRRTTRYIKEADLLRVYRDKLRNNPTRPTNDT